MILEQLRHVDSLEHPAHDLSRHKFSVILDAYLAHLVRGPSPQALPLSHRHNWWSHAQRLRDELDERIKGVIHNERP